MHDDRTNTYSFMFNGVKIMLVAAGDHVESKLATENFSLLSLVMSEEELQDSEVVCAWWIRSLKRRQFI